MTHIYQGLPFEFHSPRVAAEHIASLTTRAERNQYIDAIPPVWQKLIRHEAAQLLAADIVAIGNIDERRIALTRVPEEWLTEVKSHVVRLWKLQALFRRETELRA